MSGLFAISFPIFAILGFETKINVGLHDVPIKKRVLQLRQKKFKDHCLKTRLCFSFLAFVRSSH